MLAFLLSAAFLSLWLGGPPRPVPATAPPDAFSAERASKYVEEIAVLPHPVRTPEHARVRDAIVAELTRLGLSPEIQWATAVGRTYPVAGRIENIVARLRGTSGSRDALMLACHYDSVPAGPGAADDGSGVAALLETLRALRAGPALRNDVILLIDDGEEAGLLGASAFMAEHPWAKDVRLVINLEARGNAGPSTLFETSDANGPLIRELARAVPRATGTSLAGEVYKRMPNDTDMTVFKAYGVAGLNFAFIGHVEAYHTPLDTPSALDRGSLQQQGSYALALARRFGDGDLSNLRGPDAVYFTLPGRLFVHYPSSFRWTLVVVAAVLALGAYARALWKRETSLGGTILALPALLALTVATGAAAWVVAEGVALLQSYVLPLGEVRQSPAYLAAVVALVLSLWVSGYALLRKKLAPGTMAAASVWLLLGGAVALARWAPGGSYLLVWPAIFAAATLASLGDTWRSLAAECALALPALLLFPPLITAFQDAMGLQPVSALAIGLALAALFASLACLLERVATVGSKKLVLTALTVGVALLVGAVVTTRFDRKHPMPSAVVYALDADAGKACWASSARHADAWTADLVGADPLRGTLGDCVPSFPTPGKWLEHEAPTALLEGPEVKIDESEVDGNERTVTLHVGSPRLARTIDFWAPAGRVVEASIDDHGLPLALAARWSGDGRWALRYVGFPVEGVSLRLRIHGSSAFPLTVIERSPGLPSVANHPAPPRPPESVPDHGGDETLVLRRFTVGS